MNSDIDPLDLTPEEFEAHVESWFKALGSGLPRFKVTRRELLEAADGDYEVDVVVRFETVGLDFLTLVECKRHRNPIKREIIQTLHAKVLSTGAHKGVVVSTAPFQSGAVEFARVHGIAIIEMMRGRTAFICKSHGEYEFPDDAPKVVGWIYTIGDDGVEHLSLVDTECGEPLKTMLSLPEIGSKMLAGASTGSRAGPQSLP